MDSQGHLTGLVEFHPLKRESCRTAEPLKLGSWVVAQVEDGEDLGRIIRFVEDEQPCGVVLRSASPEDLEQNLANRARASEMMEEFEELIGRSGLPVKVVGTHYQWDRRRVIFYFTASQRLDLRSIHKEISQRLGLRVVIRHVGARDYTRVMGGVGRCGRTLCCSLFLSEFRSITLRMAHQQNLYMMPERLTGVCGKLFCCLGFEDQAYQRV